MLWSFAKRRSNMTDIPAFAPDPSIGRQKLFLLICVVLAFGFWLFVCTLAYDDSAAVNRARLSDYTFSPPDPQSESGFLKGMRNTILPSSAVDGCQWIMLTQRMVHNGDWRMRWTDIDNSPHGREVHWSSLLPWTIIAFAWTQSVVTGIPLAQAVAPASLWTNPVYLGLLILTVPFFTARRFGLMAGAVVALLMGSVYPFMTLFSYAAPDHHGLAAIGGLLTTLLLVAGGGGWAASDEAARYRHTADWFPLAERTARQHFMIAGFWSGFGLWISAATAVPVFLAIGFATLLNAWSIRRLPPVEGQVFRPSLWAWWGNAAAVSSIFFYLLEYFPSHLGMRLEVNHPLYSLAMWGGGQVLSRLGSRLTGPMKIPARSDLAGLLAGAAACGALPLCILASQGAYFNVADPFLWLLHVNHIHEFKPLTEIMAGRPLGDLPAVVSIIPISLIPLAWLTLGTTTPAPTKTLLVLAAAPPLLLTALGLQQFRWLNVATGLWFVPVVILVSRGSRSDTTLKSQKMFATLGSIVLMAVIIQYPQAIIRSAIAADPQGDFSTNDKVALAMRDVAHRLRARTGPTAPVILSGPTTTTWFMYYGGMRGVGTLYWENIVGLKAAAAINAATGEQEAIDMITRQGITHIVVCSVDAFVEEYASLHRTTNNLSNGAESFLGRLLDSLAIPSWLLPLHFSPADSGVEVLVFEVCPRQPQEQFSAAVAHFHRERGELGLAIPRFAESLARNPNQPQLRIELGTALAQAGRNDEGMEEIKNGAATITDELQRSKVLTTAARLLVEGGNYGAAIDVYQMALSATPQSTSAKCGLAWILATAPDASERDGRRAVQLAQEVVEFEPRAIHLETLAAALAETGNFTGAAALAQRAVTAAQAARQPALAEKITERMRAYREGKPLRMPKAEEFHRSPPSIAPATLSLYLGNRAISTRIRLSRIHFLALLKFSSETNDRIHQLLMEPAYSSARRGWRLTEGPSITFLDDPSGDLKCRFVLVTTRASRSSNCWL